jgi:hypothetical protein
MFAVARIFVLAVNVETVVLGPKVVEYWILD